MNKETIYKGIGMFGLLAAIALLALFMLFIVQTGFQYLGINLSMWKTFVVVLAANIIFGSNYYKGNVK